MKKVFLCIVFCVFSVSNLAQIVPISQFRLEVDLHYTPPIESYDSLHKLPHLFEERVDLAMRELFTPFLQMQYLTDVEHKGVDLFGPRWSASTARNAFSGSFKSAGRQVLLDGLESTIFSPDQVKDWAQGLFQKIFTGYEETNNPVSPFRPEEGIPGTDGRISKGFDYGLRPFRTQNQYAFISYANYAGDKQLYVMHARGYFRNYRVPTAEIINELPLLYSWKFVGAVQISGARDVIQVYQENYAYLATIGLSSVLWHGQFYSGVRVYPKPQLTVLYAKYF